METEFGEQLVHLTQIGGVAVRIEHGQRCRRVSNVHGHDAVSSPRAKLQYVDVFPSGHPRHLQLPRDVIRTHSVRRRIGGEESELGRHRRRHRPHYQIIDVYGG